MTRRAIAVGGGVVVVLAVVWFAPVLVGRQFTTVPTHQTAVYPWHGVLPFNGDKYAQSDQADLNAPWEALEVRAIRQRTVPFWSAGSFGGQPIMANGSSGVLYPPRLLFGALTSSASVHTLLSLFHVVAAGLFMYLLLIELGLTVPAAVLGAVAWMFGTYTLDWIQLEVVAPVFAWLPAGVLTVRRAVLRSRRWIGACALVVGMLLVGTHLPFAGVTIAAFMGYGALLALLGREDRPRRLGRVAAAGLLGIALAAVTLVPTAIFLVGANRASFDYHTLVTAFLLAPSALRYFFYPPPHGVGITAAASMHQAAFVGTAVVAAALFGACLRAPGTGLGRVFVAVPVLVAIGGPATWVAYHLVPGMKAFRPYSRLLFLADFGIAVLGAIGFDRFLHLVARGRRDHVRRDRLAIVVASVVVLGTALQLGVYGRHANPPFASSSSIYPTTPLLNALARLDAGSPHRILPLRLDAVHMPMLFGGEAMMFGIDSSSGFESVVDPRTVALWEVTRGKAPTSVVGVKSPQDFIPSWDLATTRFDLLPRLGIDRIVSAPEVLVDPAPIRRLEAAGWHRAYEGDDGIIFAWTGPDVGPHVVARARVVHSDLAAMTAFTDPRFDYRSKVVLESAGSHGGGGEVVTWRRGVNTIDLTVRSAGGYLVVPDMWDRGWKARVNGHSVKVLRANFNQQALAVPAGRLHVILRYRPPGLAVGSMVSLMTLCIVVALVATARAGAGSPEAIEDRVEAGPIAASGVGRRELALVCAHTGDRSRRALRLGSRRRSL